MEIMMVCKDKKEGLENLHKKFGLYDANVQVEDIEQFSYFIKFEKKPRHKRQQNYQIKNEVTKMMLESYKA